MTHFRKILVGAALALALPVASHASTLLFTDAHDYGRGAGEFNPAGTDPLALDYVVVRDNSTVRFFDFFDFSSISGTIDSIELELDYFDADDDTTNGVQENWESYIIGNDPTTTTDYERTTLIDSLSPQTITISAASDLASGATAFARSVANQELAFRLREFSDGVDEFRLRSAEIRVFGTTAPVPLPASGLMLLAAVGGAAALRRKAKKA